MGRENKTICRFTIFKVHALIIFLFCFVQYLAKKYGKKSRCSVFICHVVFFCNKKWHEYMKRTDSVRRIINLVFCHKLWSLCCVFWGDLANFSYFFFVWYWSIKKVIENEIENQFLIFYVNNFFFFISFVKKRKKNVLQNEIEIDAQ